MSETHTHEIQHEPSSGSGYAVCDCGATIQIRNGRPIGDWHTCALCTHSYGLPKRRTP